MAHHKSAIKRIRRNDSANLRNSSYLAGVRTAVKKFRAAVKEGGADLNPLFVSAQKIVAKAAQKGLLHKNNAARTVSRLAKLLKTASEAPKTAGTAAAVKKAPAKKSAAATAAAAKKKKAAKKKVTTKK